MPRTSSPRPSGRVGAADRGAGKSEILAYLLWLCGGSIFGTHHFYIGRDEQCFLWLTSCGLWGVGWFRDMFKLSGYVEEANMDHEFTEKRKIERQHHLDKPKFSLFSARFIGQYFFGSYFQVVAYRAFVHIETENPLIGNLLCRVVAGGVVGAVGIYLAGNLGKFQVPLAKTMASTVAAELVQTLFTARTDGEVSCYWTVIIGCIVSNYFRTWAPDKRRRGSQFKRGATIGFWYTVWSALFISMVLNISVTPEGGEETTLRQQLHNVLKSPAFKQFMTTLSEIWQKLLKEGFTEEFWKDFVERLDVEGEANAYDVLGLDKSTAEYSDVRKAYRNLSLKWHPDKWQSGTEAEKAEADTKMSEINQAKETLDKLFDKRKNKSSKRRGASSED